MRWRAAAPCLTFPALVWGGPIGHHRQRHQHGRALARQLSSLWGYRREIASSPRAIAVLAVPSFFGGLIGSLLLVKTDKSTFEIIVPYLILAATLLFMIQEPLSRWQRRRAVEAHGDHGQAGNLLVDSGHYPLHRWLAVLAFQLVVAIYGGYFGAGIGILMLAAFGFLGLRNIHHMNGLKNINGMAINAVAAVLFIVKGLVDWRLAALMAAGSIAGGYAGAGTAQRIGQKNVRRIVILIGFVLTIALLLTR